MKTLALVTLIASASSTVHAQQPTDRVAILESELEAATHELDVFRSGLDAHKPYFRAGWPLLAAGGVALVVGVPLLMLRYFEGDEEDTTWHIRARRRIPSVIVPAATMAITGFILTWVGSRIRGNAVSPLVQRIRMLSEEIRRARRVAAYGPAAW